MFDKRMAGVSHRDVIVQDITDIILDIFDMHDDILWSLRELDLLMEELTKEVGALPPVKS
ncbi:hypothetical protein A3D62_01560 [Candidatus Kaiserbacteria bacterium RIFCSPHIGHO2_02_FULL_49_11]|uniref:Uncharacterized protein n=1 Tax=Candidatus Kaiserbacteria bacterium RIFCSPHIGHO2_02_FULL_49_11 TaxID=1798489 RepID=A0A1F6D1W7_9BACT|nr:MAG: hypothetical protein A3D62_01560 [Candidatus Kaiserbacteria bacterium RIFCSPHIGHO2_02_FULL_49_11]